MIIYNLAGKMVYQLSATSYQLSAGITWNASNYPSGVYTVRVETGGKTLFKNIILVK